MFVLRMVRRGDKMGIWYLVFGIGFPQKTMESSTFMSSCGRFCKVEVFR